MEDIWSFHSENFGDGLNQLRLYGIQGIDFFMRTIDDSNPVLTTLACIILILLSLILILGVTGFILGILAIFICSFLCALVTVLSIYCIVVENVPNFFAES